MCQYPKGQMGQRRNAPNSMRLLQFVKTNGQFQIFTRLICNCHLYCHACDRVVFHSFQNFLTFTNKTKKTELRIKTRIRPFRYNHVREALWEQVFNGLDLAKFWFYQWLTVEKSWPIQFLNWYFLKKLVQGKLDQLSHIYGIPFI